MSSDDQHVHPGSEIDLALNRALEAAKLEAGDASTTSTSFVGHPEPFSSRSMAMPVPRTATSPV
jgi:hypothetical protein